MEFICSNFQAVWSNSVRTCSNKWWFIYSCVQCLKYKIDLRQMRLFIGMVATYIAAIYIWIPLLGRHKQNTIHWFILGCWGQSSVIVSITFLSPLWLYCNQTWINLPAMLGEKQYFLACMKQQQGYLFTPYVSQDSHCRHLFKPLTYLPSMTWMMTVSWIGQSRAIAIKENQLLPPFFVLFFSRCFDPSLH